MRRLFSYIALLLVLPSTMLAQWKEVAPNILTPFTPGFGALHFADGTIWIGNNELWSSADTGKTWQKSSYVGTQIRDIHFLDRFIGLVGSENQGVQLTRDGGKTWKHILDAEIWEASFNGSPNIIHALATGPAQIYTTLDGGATWSFKHLSTYGMGIAIASDSRIYTFAGERYQTSSRGWVNYSTDYGATWSNNGATIDGDSYTISVDSCDNRRLYLVNEDYASSNDGVSQVFISTNGGLTWAEALADSGLFLNGSLAMTSHTLYAGSVLGAGTFRSTDKGTSWKSIGGPPIGYDSRAMYAISDNLVVALSVNGSVWITENSGGDSLTVVNDMDTIAGAAALSEPKASPKPGDTVQVGVHVKFPTVSAVNTIVPQEITYVVRFAEDIVGIIPSTDIEKSILAPAGWVFKNGQLTAGKLTVTLTNFAKKALAFDQDFGKVILTALPAPTEQTAVSLERLSIFASCNAYVSYFGIEKGHIKTIIIRPLGVQSEPWEEPELTVFPNPAAHILYLQSSAHIGQVYTELYDELGKRHSAQSLFLGSTPGSLDIRSLANGVYYLRIEAAGFTRTKRVVINR